MNHDRNALITAYRHYTGCTDTEADRIIRGVELAYAKKQNAELQRALDEADTQPVQAEAETRARLKRALFAYRMCFQRAQARGWAADRASERLASVMEANQELLITSVGNQVDSQRFQSWLERFPEVHMRFGVIDAEGETEMLPCADWCYACKLDQLQTELAECKERLETS